MTSTSTRPRRDRRTVRPTREDVRERVLAAGREVFVEDGYHRASLDRVATRAGFSKGAVYSNFAGKDDLFLTLLERETRRIRDDMAAVVAAMPSAGGREGLEQDLLLLAEAMLAEARDGRAQRIFAEFRAHAAGNAALARRTAEVRAPLIEESAQMLEQVVTARGHRMRIDAREAATTLLALSNGLALEQVGVDGEVVSAAGLATFLHAMVEAA